MANANKMNSATKVKVLCRISFANIFEPKSINGGEAKYSVSCLIPKDDKKTLLAIHKAVEAAKEDGKVRKWGGKLPPNLKLPLRDGDIDRTEDENYQKHFFLNATSKDAPQVVDRHVQPVTDPMMVYSGWNAASEYGYYSWACKDGQGKVWKFQRDVSIYGPDAEKCELVTPILTYDDIETLQEIIRLLRKAGAKSSPSRGCGVHIHIGKGDHTAKTIRNLVNIMAAHEQQIGRAIRIDAARTGHYCQVVNHRFLDRLNREKPTTMHRLEDIWYEGNGADYGRSQHYNSSRYHMLNLHATFTKGTIEFCLFQFADPADGKRNGLHAGEMKAYIQLCLAMSQLAKMVRTASPKPQQTDNEKYAMDKEAGREPLAYDPQFFYDTIVELMEQDAE